MGWLPSHSLFRMSSTPYYAKIIINLQFLGLIILFNAVKDYIVVLDKQIDIKWCKLTENKKENNTNYIKFPFHKG